MRCSIGGCVEKRPESPPGSSGCTMKSGATERYFERIPAERATGALRWWRVLLPGSGASFHEDSLGDRRYRLTSRDVSGGVTVTARLDPRGFPAELTVEGMQEEPVTYRLSGWHFGPAHGPASYHLSAPAGWETVDLP